MNGQVMVISATIAFGMGIDKRSVRFVAHWNLPNSVTSYYQESGRAGRDGNLSFARIFYSKKDRDVLIKHLEDEMKKIEGESEGRVSARMDDLKIMIMYCESVTCRHALFSRYYGDENPVCVDKCDTCQNKGDVAHQLSLFKRNSIIQTMRADEIDAMKEISEAFRKEIYTIM